MTTSRVLVLDVQAGSLAETASRMRRLRLPVLYAKSLGEADRILHAEGPTVGAVLFPPELSDSDFAALRERLLEHALERFPGLVVVGAAPDPATRARLRAAGVEHALWEPFDDGALRFVVNEALASSDAIAARERVRVPTSVLARVEVGGRCKQVHVYSLSGNGAFLETARPSMRGARLKLEIPLPDGTIDATARVVFTNVPGNLQRPKLPLGMGVRFDSLDPEQTARLRRYVEERASQISV